jgi:hypothetical protein
LIPEIESLMLKLKLLMKRKYEHMPCHSHDVLSIQVGRTSSGLSYVLESLPQVSSPSVL